jgi:hypothetical protein
MATMAKDIIGERFISTLPFCLKKIILKSVQETFYDSFFLYHLLLNTKTDLVWSVTLLALYGDKRPNASPHSSLPVWQITLLYISLHHKKCECQCLLISYNRLFHLYTAFVSSQVKPVTFRHKPYNILLLGNSLPVLKSVTVSCHV